MAPRWNNPTRPNYGPSRNQTPAPAPTPGPPRTPSQPSPPSEYTRQVTEGGIAAYQQARAGRRHGLPAAQANYQDTGVFAYNQPVPQPSEQYQDWLASMMPTFDPNTQYGFGRTADGAYAGFKTQGALQAAIRGAAETQRAQDRERFEALDEVANQRLDTYAQQYGDAQSDAEDYFSDRYMWGNVDAAKPVGYIGDPDDNMLAYQQQVVQAMNDGTPPPRSSAPTMPMVLSDRGRDLATGPVERFVGVGGGERFAENELNPWLAEVSAPDMDVQAFAQSGLATPLRPYAMQAGAAYGVDPFIVGGWYDEASAIGDARDQQTLDFLEQTGMTPQTYEQALNELERQQALDDAAAGDMADAYSEQEQALIDQAGYEATGGLATTSELAAGADVPLATVYDILQNSTFADAQADINAALDALATGEGDMQVLADTMTGVLDNALATDPALYAVIDYLYRDYIPQEYDPYGPR